MAYLQAITGKQADGAERSWADEDADTEDSDPNSQPDDITRVRELAYKMAMQLAGTNCESGSSETSKGRGGGSGRPVEVRVRVCALAPPRAHREAVRRALRDSAGIVERNSLLCTPRAAGRSTVQC